jgi:hypothetical protein
MASNGMLLDGSALTKKTRGSVGQVCVTHILFCFEETLYRTFYRCFLTNFIQFGHMLQRIFFKLANHKQELPMAAMAILYMLNGLRREDFFIN